MYTGQLITRSISSQPKREGRSIFGQQLWVDNQPDCGGEWWFVCYKLVSLQNYLVYRLLSFNPSTLLDISEDAFFHLQMNDAFGAVLSSPIFKLSCSSPCLFHFIFRWCWQRFWSAHPWAIHSGVRTHLLRCYLSQILHWKLNRKDHQPPPISVRLRLDILSPWLS